MKAIWKFPLEITDTQVIEVPEGAEFISVIEQGGIPTLYAIVNPHAVRKASYRVQIRGTGHPIESTLLPSYRFIGTVQTGIAFVRMVWHVFIERR